MLKLKKLKKIILYFITFFCLIANVFSQEYSFKLFGAKDGFELPEINSVFQDSRGYLWTGSLNGINRYDGNSIINYNKSDGLVDNFVLGINEGTNHNIWISTKSGISSFDGKSFINYKIAQSNNSTIDFYFQNIIETSKGTIYAFGGRGLFLLHKQSKEFVKVSQINCNVRDVVEDKNGRLWLATINGFYLLKNNVFSKIEIDTAKIVYSLTSIAIDRSGIIWLGSTKGIIKYDGKQFEKYFTAEEAKNKIRDVLVDSDSSVLFTSDAPELKIYKSGQFKTIDLSHLINRSNILRIIQDKEGSYWMASTAGLIKMYSKPFSKYYLSDSIKAPITSIAITKSNNLFFGSTQGLFSLSDKGILKKYIPNNNPDEQYIISLLPTDSFLMAGTYSGQVFKFVNGVFTPFGGIDYNGSNPVYQIVPYKERELWICKGFNVVNYKDGKFVMHDFSEPLSSFTQSALVDSKGSVWFAHATNFTKYENGKFIEIGAKDGFNYEGTATLCEDKNKNIWIGTYGNGIVKYNGKTYKNYTVKEGLISNYIASCLFDKKTNALWIGTINGVSKLTLDNNSEINAISNYNNEQGLESAECNQNSIFQLPNQNILFGTANGLYEYNQTFNKKRQSIPQLNFLGLRLNYENTAWSFFTDSINSWSKMPLNLKLPYNKNHLTFDFIGVNLNDISNVKYQWMLDGFDSNWNPQSKNQSATYSNLPFGKYLFKVRACNLDGVWSEPISYSFIINPPIWKTWWFIFLSAIFIAIIIWVSIKTKINQVKKVEAKKISDFKRIAELELKAMRAQMNPHFMFNTLNSIQDIILNNDTEKSQIYLAELSQLMRLILENSTQKRIRLCDEIEFIRLYINLEQLRFGHKFEVKINISEDIDDYSVSIPPMLLQPYIENAILHGLMHKKNDGVLEVDLKLNSKGDVLECCIKDNGVGRVKSKELSEWKSKKHKSMGIEITTERIHLLNSIESTKGFDVVIIDLEDNNQNPMGTLVKILIPIKA